MKKYFLILIIILSHRLYAQWQPAWYGLPSSNVSQIMSFDDVIFVTSEDTTGDFAGLYWSFDDGQSWAFRSDNNLYSTFKNRLIKYYNNEFYFSLDSGLTYFTSSKNDILLSNPKSIVSPNTNNAEWLIDYSDTVIACLYYGIYKKSADSCLAWSDHVIDNSTNETNSRCFIHQSELYFIQNYSHDSGTLTGRIFKLNQNNQIELVYDMGYWANRNIYDAVSVDNKIFFCDGFRVYLYDSTVVHINTLPEGVWIRPSILANYGDSVFVAFVYGIGVYNNFWVYACHKNDYFNWHMINDGFPTDGPGPISQLFVFKNFLFAVTDSGLYRRTLTPFVSSYIKQSDFIVNLFPNPVSILLNISIPENSLPAEITVYDIYGKNCNEFIVNTAESKADISELPKGIYIVKVMSKTGVESYKILKE